VHARRLASDEFREAVPGFCTPAAAPATLELAARTLQRKVLPGAVISHASAAELLGIPLPREHEYSASKTVHCSLPHDRRRRPGRGIHVHNSTDASTMRLRGIVVSGPVQLLCELAKDLGHDQLVACCDHLVGPASRARPALSLARLRALVADAGPRYRIAAVRAAVADARERVESPKETQTRLLLRSAGFAEPEVNRTLRAPGSDETFRLDLSYPALRVAIEYDGIWHSTDRSRHRRDRRKDDVLHQLGWRVVRLADSDLLSPRHLLDRLVSLGVPGQPGIVPGYHRVLNP